MNKSGIKGFILYEVLVVIILSTIFIGIVYSVYAITTKQFITFVHQNNELINYSLFKKVFTYDFENCLEVHANGKEIEFQGEEETTIYRFNDSCIVRMKYNAIDTFALCCVKHNFEFRDQPFESGIVEFISFSLEAKGHVFDGCFRKEYGADELIENQSFNSTLSDS